MYSTHILDNTYTFTGMEKEIAGDLIVGYQVSNYIILYF